MLLITYLHFIVTSIFCFYIPGKIIINTFLPQLNYREKFILAWFVGLAFFTFMIYGFAWIHADWITLSILMLAAVYFCIRIQNEFLLLKKMFLSADKLSLFIILIGSLVFTFALFFSGYQTSDGVQFYWINARDGVQHISFIKNMVSHFPPEKPDLAGEAFRGYHYFHDLILSRFNLHFGFKAEDLYFRLFPLLISFFYGGAIYLYTSLFTKDAVLKRFVLISAYFAQSSTILFMIFQRGIDLTNDASVQPLGLIINPYNILSLSLLFIGFYCLMFIRKSWRYAVFVGLFFGILAQFKVYVGLTALGTFVILSIIELIKKKLKLKSLINYGIAGSIMAVLTALTFLPNNLGAGGLVFAPFAIYAEFMQKVQFSSLQWELQRQIFAADNNYPRLIILFGVAVGFYWLINIGMRIIVILKTRQLFSRMFWQSDLNLQLFIAIMFCLFIGSFFIQTVSPLDIVQFFWIILVLTTIPTGLILGTYFKKSWVYKTVIILFLITFTLPGVIDFLLKNISEVNKLSIPNSMVHFTQQVAAAVDEDEMIVYLPDQKVTELPSNTLIMSALTGRSNYLETGGMPSSDNHLVQKRLKIQEKLQKVTERCDLASIKHQLKIMQTRNLISAHPLSCVSDTDVITILTTPQREVFFYQFK